MSRPRQVEVGRVSAVLRCLIGRGRPVAALDQTTGEIVAVSPQLAAAPHGFLPLFLAAGDTVWRDATGRSLGIELQPDPQTVLGQRVQAIGSPAFAPVMLSMMEAMAQAQRPDMLLLNDLHGPWMAAQERLHWRRQMAALDTALPTPAPLQGLVQALPSEPPRSLGMRP